MTAGKATTRKQYQWAIDTVIADLGLHELSITWRWRRPPCGGCGLAQMTGASATIYIWNRMSHEETLITLAHELRHIWQRTTGIYTRSVDRNLRVRSTWKGTSYAPVPQVWGDRISYQIDPREQDARAYADNVLKRLFALTYQRKPDTISEAVNWMVMAARKKQ